MLIKIEITLSPKLSQQFDQLLTALAPDTAALLVKLAELERKKSDLNQAIAQSQPTP